MKGYSTDFDRENFASARAEGINVSYKDLAEVCGRIRGRNADRALEFLEKVSEGKAAVLYKRHNKRIGLRRELGGKKGRYPRKAAKAVLKVLSSAVANGRTRAMGETYQIVHAVANKLMTYGRVAPKGRWARSDYETSRVEIVLKPLETVPKGVEVTPPAKPEVKKEEKPKEEKKPEVKKEEKKPEVKKEEKPKEEPKKEEKPKEEKPKEEPKKEEKPKEEKPKEEPKKVEEKKPEPKKEEPKEEKKEEPKKEEKTKEAPKEEKKESDVKKEEVKK